MCMRTVGQDEEAYYTLAVKAVFAHSALQEPSASVDQRRDDAVSVCEAQCHERLRMFVALLFTQPHAWVGAPGHAHTDGSKAVGLTRVVRLRLACLRS